MRLLGRGVIVFMLVGLWCVAISFGIGFGLMLWPQIDSGQRFVAASGTVTGSDVATTQHRGKRGRITHRHRPDIDYTYVVAGTTYRGSRFTFGDETTRDLDAVNAILREHPIGAAVQIHHDPDDPSRSCIRPSLHAGSATGIFFAVPALIALCWATHAGICHLRRGDRPAWLIEDDGELARLRGSVAGPWLIAMIIAGVFSIFALIVALIFALIVALIMALIMVSVFDPPTLPLTFIGATIAAASAGFWIRRATLVSGTLDLHLNRSHREITLPTSIARDAPRELRFDDIAAIDVLRSESRGSKGQRIISFTPRLHRRGGALLPASVFAGSEAKAVGFGTWLSTELGARFNGVIDESAAASEAGD